MSELYLSIVVPAYNEEARLAPSLEKIYGYLRAQPYRYELIVVSDGSRDGTARVAQEWKPSDCPLIVIDRKENRGKGYTVREGAASATGRIVLFSDADLSTPIEDTAKLLPYFQEGYDMVIGSRSLKQSEIVVRQPFHRQLMGRVFNGLVRFLAVPGIADTQCGFKAFSRKAIEEIFPRCLVDGFSFDVEMLFLARKLGLRVKEVPIRWVDSPSSTVSPIRDSLRMLKEIFQVRLNDRRGRYK